MVRVKVTKDAVSQLQEAKERYDKQNDLLKKIGKEPPAGLIPIGDTGLYGTPEVISPKDCEFYPDSPYCGGNPISRDIIGLDVDYGVDGCSVHASVTPTLGFTKLPTHTIVYVREECRDEYEKREKENAKPPIPPPPDDIDFDYNPKPAYRPSGFALKDIVCAVVIRTKFRGEQNYIQQIGEWASIVTGITPEMTTTYYPGNIIVDSFYPQNTHTTASANTAAIITRYGSYNAAHGFSIGLGYNSGGGNTITNWSGGIPWDMPNANSQQYGNWQPGTPDEGNYRYTGFSFAGEFSSIELYIGKFGDIFPTVEMPVIRDIGATDTFRAIQVYQRIPVYCRKLNEKPKPPFIPPNDRKRKCCMQCCGSQTGQGQQKQNQDLAEIKKMLRQVLKNQGTFPYSVQLFDANEEKQGAQTKNVSIPNIAQATKLAVERTEKTNKMVGIDEFPIYVPGSIVWDESNGIFGDLKDLKNALIKKKIGSIAEFLAWKTEQDNNIFGRWQEVIEMETSPAVKDKDGRVTKPAKKERIVLPNMARTFKELIMLSHTQIKILGYVMDTTLKLAVDLAGTKIEIAQAHAVVQDIQDFLDYPTEEKLLEIPLQISIPSSTDSVDDKEDLQRFLSESKAKAKYEDWTGEGSLHDLMVTLLDAAAMIRAVFYQRS